MSELQDTFEWTTRVDISDILASLEDARYAPIVAVGSGGSLSAAHHIARLQRVFHSRVSVAMTPYQFRAEPAADGAHCWIFSAGGSNVDVVASVLAASRAETLTVNVMTMRRRSALSRLASKNPSIRLHYLAAPSKKDGFLATNSLLAFCAVLTRAYLEMNGRGSEWQTVGSQLHQTLKAESRAAWHSAVSAVGGFEHLIVLHDDATSLGAFDLESKLIEAGIAGVQLADYRHFAHGRHHWLAKNGDNTGVLAFTADADSSLSRRTLGLIPRDIPVARIQVPGYAEVSQLVSLLATFYVTEALSFARGIDPGQPGVPEFGRKLYSLSVGRPTTRRRPQVAIDRKLAEQPKPRDLDAHQTLRDIVSDAHRRFEDHLIAAPLGGIVLDYDGTIVDTRDRFQPPAGDLSAEIVRLLESGIPIGIATGRGRSAGADLRHVIPKALWASVLIGYYNGSLVRELADTEPLDVSEECSGPLLEVHNTLKQFGSSLKLTLRPNQLTVESEGSFLEARLWERVRALVDDLDLQFLRVLRSSHSVDVLDRSATKLNVVEALSSRAMALGVLRIGDRGCWPGNDYEFLASYLGLSVDQVSPDLNTCWNIAPEGVRGSRATVYYLRSVTVRNELGQFRSGAE